MDAVPSVLAKLADMLPLEFRNIKRKILRWDNTSFNVVVRGIILRGTYLEHVAGLKY